jgi:hypothetical protein
MNASKERASEAINTLMRTKNIIDTAIMSDVVKLSVYENIQSIGYFLDAAYNKLPKEASYEREKERKSKKTPAPTA